MDPEPTLATHWLEAAARPSVRAALDAIHQLIADQIESRGPACWASGRCCNFEAFGHRLYTTGLETAACFLALPTHHRTLTTPDLDSAISRGGCPFQSANLCSVQPIKPAACRIFFCDRSAEPWQTELTERVMQQIRVLHDREQIEYRYAEWRSLLRSFIPA
jgi:Fe-S-cluster containining protein